MRFSREYTKLQDRVFTTIRSGQPRYGAGHEIQCRTPGAFFNAKVLVALVSTLYDLPLELLRYDTDMFTSTRGQIIEMILGLYARGPPNPRGDWTVYLLERMEVPDVRKLQGGKT